MEFKQLFSRLQVPVKSKVNDEVLLKTEEENYLEVLNNVNRHD
jgi:hypothetical protein